MPDVVWPDVKQIGLIDSIFRNVYVPPIIFGAQLLCTICFTHAIADENCFFPHTQLYVWRKTDLNHGYASMVSKDLHRFKGAISFPSPLGLAD
jgi:hypothetical protein